MVQIRYLCTANQNTTPVLLSEKQIEYLRKLPLVEIMKAHNIKMCKQTSTNAFYHCPVHKDGDASFCVETRDSGTEAQGWHCFGCDVKGKGAITLEALLSGRDAKKDFLEICRDLARMFNICIEYADKDGNATRTDWLNGFFHRAEVIYDTEKGINKRSECEMTDGITDDSGFAFCKMPVTDELLKALGCKSAQVQSDEECEDGVLLESAKKYSWGKNFDKDWQGENFDPECVERIFSLYNVDAFVTPVNDKGKQYLVKSTQYYPIAVFEYYNEDGEPYWKKYEPLLRSDVSDFTTGKGAGKFTWYYSGAKPKGQRTMLWGDHDFMEAFRTGKCNPDSSQDTYKDTDPTKSDHPYVLEEREREDGSTQKDWKFQRLIICSGPKDGMNAYFHSNAHVCWPMSESSVITGVTIRQLLRIAKEVFIIYDIDKTGIKFMNELTLNNLEVKPVYLPADMGKYTSPISRKPLKDLTEYLCYYPTRPGRDVNYMFEGLLHNAITMKPWREIGARRNTGGGRENIIKYEILPDAIAQYAPARGIYQYQPELYDQNVQLGRFFMRVKNNIVKIIDDKDIVLELKNDLKAFLDDNYFYNNQDLRNAISTSRRMIPDTMQEIQSKNISFIHWDKDACYFFFRNTAVKVTADGIERVPYSQLPFYVNEKAIINMDFTYNGDEFFDIIYDTATMARMARNHEAALAKCTTDEERKIENRRYAEESAKNRYRLKMHRRMNDMPPAFQVIYDSCRIFWRNEAAGLKLSEEEQQMQDMHFINKALATGYILDPFRDPTRIFVVVSTDYNQYASGQPCGRNLKSFIGGQLLPLVRNGYCIAGKEIKTKADKFAENFSNYELTEHSYMYMDDLKSDIDVEMLFNTGSMISKRKLYHDAIQIQGQWVPKIMISTNSTQMFDMNAGSVFDRIWLTMHSDYYHAESANGEEPAYSPMIKFGRQIITEATDQELQETMWMLMKFCQIWKRENRDHYSEAIVRPPVEKKKSAEQLRSLVADDTFLVWIQDFFSKPSRFGVPISRREMMISYLRYKISSEENIKPSEVIITEDMIKYQPIRDLQVKIMTYCEHLPYKDRILVNPESLFADDAEWKQNRIVRTKAFASSIKEGKVDFTKPRSMQNERCYYFFRIGHVPESKEKISLTPQFDIDPWTDEQ